MTAKEKVGLFLFFVFLFLALAKGDVPQRRQLAPPAATLTCWQELDSIRESMFQSRMAEAILARRIGFEDNYQAFLKQAHTIRHTSELKPSPATCEKSNLESLRILAADWELEYLLNEAAVERKTQ